jgi:hypothetical protein
MVRGCLGFDQQSHHSRVRDVRLLGVWPKAVVPHAKRVLDLAKQMRVPLGIQRSAQCRVLTA